MAPRNHSEFGLLDAGWAFARDNDGTRTIERHGAGGSKLPFVLDKAEHHAALVRECLLAKPYRIRRAGIDILLGVGGRGQLGRKHQDDSNGAEFAHHVALQFGISERQRSRQDFVP